ncbi:DUF192 domain-containing protein [Sphingomonas sp.]|jgi:hypothetical protein|uniref:DUF192 domain-containing protein n=1 Tax=Sphingomonas sp. TaxID=28214 RepID=UPI002F235B0A
MLAIVACKPGVGTSGDNASAAAAARVPVTVASASGSHVFRVELARTPAQQEQGLMFRTGLTPDGGMLFAPYPGDGGPPRPANFWMKNTPSSLDIIFIRADGTIARIAENTVPFSEAMVSSGEPVAAVLEVAGGRTSALGIAEGDRVTWPR